MERKRGGRGNETKTGMVSVWGRVKNQKCTSSLASVPGLPRSRMHIYLSACGTQIVSQERGRPRIRLQLLAFLKSDWSDAWLLLLIVTRTVNSIEPASYSRNLVHITYYSGH